MTNDEAKFILTAYRPNGRDASDPAMAEALEQAARDPELGAWFREEIALDQVISQKLSEVKAPTALKASILAGHRMMVRPDSSSRVGWSRLWKWAAMFVVGVGLATVLSLKGPSNDMLAQFRSDMMESLGMEAGPLDFQGRSLVEVRNWLAEQGHSEAIAVSDALSRRPTMGCRILDWKGAQVTLVCFETGGGQLAHLLVVDRSALPGLEDFSEPILENVSGWSTVSWADSDRVYLLAGQATRQELQGFL